MAPSRWPRLPCIITQDATVGPNGSFDGLVLVSNTFPALRVFNENFAQLVETYSAVDKSVESDGCVLPLESQYGSKRLIYAPTGPVDRDYDDVRRYGDAALKGMKRALSAGCERPALAVVPNADFPNATLVAVLGALEALYVPLQLREHSDAKSQKVKHFAIYGTGDAVETVKIIRVACAIESGRFVARDIGGGDPERMAPPRVANYVTDLFENSVVSVEIISDTNVFEKEYPLFAAVNRAASVIERHSGRIIYLRYEGEGPITKTVMLVGKGITYDTGGADVKAGGHMAGMSRDKCGAAAVVGFFQTLSMFQPKGIKAIGALAVARNSIGENCYVADEVITSRAGLRVRIGNTDAEGRMVMTDVLCKMKELALNEINPHLCTIATLTGHACLAVGPYTAVMDNGPANAVHFAKKIQHAGFELGDMMDISTIRREDFNFVKCGTGDGEDLLQCNNLPSSRTPRGHQFPAAFMIEAAGLDKHGGNSPQPLRYTHFDIAGSGGDVPNNPTGVPIIALSNYFFGDQFYVKEL